jgi:hypothetical protein
MPEKPYQMAAEGMYTFSWAPLCITSLHLISVFNFHSLTDHFMPGNHPIQKHKDFKCILNVWSTFV